MLFIILSCFPSNSFCMIRFQSNRLQLKTIDFIVRQAVLSPRGEILPTNELLFVSKVSSHSTATKNCGLHAVYILQNCAEIKISPGERSAPYQIIGNFGESVDHSSKSRRRGSAEKLQHYALLQTQLSLCCIDRCAYTSASRD